MAAFSVLYTINIAVSNLSLQLVTVPVRPRLPLLECFSARRCLLIPLFGSSSTKSSAHQHRSSRSSSRVYSSRGNSQSSSSSACYPSSPASDSRKRLSSLPPEATANLVCGGRTYGDYYFTAWGLILTLLGTFLAALKTVITNVIQTGGGGRLKLVGRAW